MKLLGIKNTKATTPHHDILPANLHDYKGEVYQDVLYSIYNISIEAEGSEINVDMIAKNLIKHTNSNNQKGYWVGIAINKELLDVSKVYKGVGEVDDLLLKQPIEPELIQEDDDVQYGAFYFDAKEVRYKGNNKAYIVVDRQGIHYHYNLNFSTIEIVDDVAVLEEVRWKRLTANNLKNHYLFGIDLSDPSGNPLPDSLFIHYLNSSIEYLQNLLDITIPETECTRETHDYIRNDYQNWGFIQLSHRPVKEVKALRLMYGERPSLEIPLDWIQLDKLSGQITLFPVAGSASSLIIGQTGMLFGLQNRWDYAPQLWEVDYVAGIDENDPNMPVALMEEAINKRTSCGVLNVWGDLIIGAGIASQSVSVDGISTSIGTTQSAMFGGASARIEAYTKDLNDIILPALKMKFSGIRMIVV